MAAGATPAARVICILGMHRSGTSLVARLLSFCGMDLGPPAHLIQPGADNPEGYWEHRGLVRINDEILRRFGGRWYRPPPFPSGWEQQPKLEPLYARARAIIAADFGQASRWGWKDPRATLTLPFWQKLSPDLAHVLCVRHPLDVARSLQRRNGFSLARGCHLWTLYTAAALRHTRGRPRVITRYESYFNDWRAELARVARFLGLTESWPRSTVAEMQSVIQPVLRHFSSTLTDLELAEGVDENCRELYATLAAGDETDLDALAEKAGDAAQAACASGSGWREWYGVQRALLTNKLYRLFSRFRPPA